MKKIKLILPYFGKKFPQTFPLLLHSLSVNCKVNFLIFTNIHDPILNKYNGGNIAVEYTKLADIKKLATKKLNFEVNLNTPYKLCDFKPFYGLIFEDYLGDADWWGYFDSDIIFGDLNSFVETDLFTKYERIFTHGHLTFYKNIPNVNKIVLKDFHLRAIPTYRRVLADKEIYGFDEWGFGKNKGRGLSWAINKTKLIKQYDNINLFADILPEHFNFETTSDKKLKYFVYENGHIIGKTQDNEDCEFLYVHFQKRPMLFNEIDIAKKIYVKPNYFSNKFNINLAKEENGRWQQFYIKSRIKHVLKNLNLNYLRKRVSFLNSEK